ncbi:hypothetical protein EDD86DRAFT_206995 [Gorgonomyces haynaldii]|nr:hypothetical protein EDD86DRAFT_206995 [Gorgonomyces haynaldii]
MHCFSIMHFRIILEFLGLIFLQELLILLFQITCLILVIFLFVFRKLSPFLGDFSHNFLLRQVGFSIFEFLSLVAYIEHIGTHWWFGCIWISWRSLAFDRWTHEIVNSSEFSQKPVQRFDRVGQCLQDFKELV